MPSIHCNFTNAFTVEPLEGRTLLSASALHIAFEPASAPPPPGYLADTGAAYGPHGSLVYGWSRRHTATAILRQAANAPAPQYNCFNILSPGMQWSIALPNGSYTVHILAGDPLSKREPYRIVANRVTVLSGSVTPQRHWIEGTATIRVTQGKLAVGALPGSGPAKIDAIDIIAVRDAQQVLPTDSPDGVGPNYLQFASLRFSPSLQSIQTSLAVPASQAHQPIEFHLDSPTGPLIGTLSPDGSGDGSASFVQSTPITATRGVHDLFVVFQGSIQAGNLDWVRFSAQPLLTIMPLGDSITQSLGGHDSYRRALWLDLQNAGYSVDFTGTQQGVRPGSGQPANFDYDQDNEGHYGYGAAQLLATLPASLAATASPNIVLLHIGTNDLGTGQDPATVLANVAQIIDTLRAYNPHVIILLAQIIPCARIDPATLATYNAGIATLAAQKTTAASRIILVDQFTGFNAATDTFDGIHPNASGEQKMADRWFAALQTLLPTSSVPKHRPRRHAG